MISKYGYTRWIKPVLSGAVGAIFVFTIILALTATASAQKREVSSDIERRSEEIKKRKEAEDQLRRSRLEEKLDVLSDQVLDMPIDPNEYFVGPGDLFSIYVWGDIDDSHESIVTPEGYLEIPSIGIVAVNGLTLGQARKKIIKASSRVYTNVEVSVSLVQLRRFRVYVTGQVNVPGTYPVYAVDRLSDVIEMAFGLDKFANGTAVEVTHIDGTKDIFDFIKFENSGYFDENIYLRNGDRIFVPQIDLSYGYVIVESTNELSGTYSLKRGESLSDFLNHQRVLPRLVDASAIYVRRKSGDIEEMFRFKESAEGMGDFTLESADKIVIPQLNDVVYVSGSVLESGAYPFIPDRTLSDYIGFAGGISPVGSSKIIFIRDGREIDSNLDTIVERGDIIKVPRKWNQIFNDAVNIIFPITSIILAAKAAGAF